MLVADLFKSCIRLEAENLLLRYQLGIALRRAPARLRMCGSDRGLLVWMVRLGPSLLGAVRVVLPETVLGGIGLALRPSGDGNLGIG